MRIIAFMNQKGGVGKTTTAANVAAGLAELGARVLLIDLDSQTNLTTYFGLTPETQVDLYDVMCGDANFNDAIQVVDEKISVIAASKDLSGVDIDLSSRADRVVVLRKKMAEANTQFDYVLMDCPPSLGLLTVNALAVAGEVIIPMQAHFLAMQGMAKLLETVQVVGRQINPRLRITGVVLTMFDSNARLSTEVVSELDRFFESARGTSAPWNEARLFRSRIRRNIKITESPSFGQTVLAYDSQSNGAKDYRELAREIAALKFSPSAIDPVGAPIPPAVSLVDRAILDAEQQVDSVRLIDEPVEMLAKHKTRVKDKAPAIDKRTVEKPIEPPVETKSSSEKIFAEQLLDETVDGSLEPMLTEPLIDDLVIQPLELPDPPELDGPLIETRVNQEIDATRLSAAHIKPAGRARKDEKPVAGDREAVA